MIVVEEICGKLSGQDQEVEYVDFEWDELNKRLHKKVGRDGTEIGIRLKTETFRKGLRDGDILYEDGNKILAVNVLPFEMLRVQVRDTDKSEVSLVKVCYEIGNRHAPLFMGERRGELFTPYNEPVAKLLSAVPGTETERVIGKPDFDRAISTAVHSHVH